MKAEFKKTNRILFIVYLVLALIWSGLVAFMFIQKRLSGGGDIVASLLVTSAIYAVAVMPFLYNRKAYLHIHGNQITGRFGLFKRLDCDITDITFVLAQFDQLHILTKDRKYRIQGVKNASAISAFIKQRIPFTPCKLTKDVLENTKKHIRNRNKKLILVFCTMGLSFVWLFITVFLTDAKDLPEFNSADWKIFSVFCVVEALTVITMLTLAIKSGKGNLQIEKQVYEVKRSVLESTALLPGPGYVKAVLTDSECSCRITVYYGCIENEAFSAYYTTEGLDTNYNLRFLYQSEVFTSEEFTLMFQGFLDITDTFI